MLAFLFVFVCASVCVNYIAKLTAISCDIKSKAANICKIAHRGKVYAYLCVSANERGGTTTTTTTGS